MKGNHPHPRQPLISVVMTVMNEVQYIRLAIDSILQQSLSDFEFIIIDDGSTDATPDILRDYANRDTRVRILTNATNLSVPKSANIGMANARGKYIARMDADDIAMPERFARQVDALERNPDIVLIGTGHEFIDSEGNVKSVHPHGSSPHIFDWISIFRPPLIQSSAMFRRSVIEQENLYYDHDFNRAADFEFWHRLLQHGRGSEIPGVYVQYRTHDRNVSTRFASKQHEVWQRAAILNASRRFPAIDGDIINDTFCFFQAIERPTPTTIANTFDCLSQMEAVFAEQMQLNTQHRHELKKVIARSLLTEALRGGVFTDPQTAMIFIRKIGRHFIPLSQVGAATIAGRVSRHLPESVTTRAAGN
ncbi:glycosyltransferase family 2 protein [Hyphococcus formosus]|uniref:glycosyltransferase family 2 protein n=1 Tax=Hyphococcus formosus TaxID=3143534 RepID=UPI00398B77BE